MFTLSLVNTLVGTQPCIRSPMNTTLSTWGDKCGGIVGRESSHPQAVRLLLFS